MSVRAYLMELSKLCAEVANDPRPLSHLLLLVRLIAWTIADLGA